MARNPKFYPLNQCALYKVPMAKLPSLLYSSRVGLEELGDTRERYSCWDEAKKSGGFRRIEAPYDNLKRVQKRIAELLQRISPPDFLMAPVKKRSYVHNAAAHKGSKAFRLLDIEDFFPSCTDKRVYWFFNKVLNCDTDVSALLTKLTTFNGHLPQGSPCSPILAYFAYQDMWMKIDKVATASSCKLSIYADDITVSGGVIYERDIWKIKTILFSYGHTYNRKKERSLINKAAQITGVIVSGQELLLPNRQHKKLQEIKVTRQHAKSPKLKGTLDRQLRGRLAQKKQILLHGHILTEEVAQERA